MPLRYCLLIYQIYLKSARRLWISVTSRMSRLFFVENLFIDLIENNLISGFIDR